MSDGKSGALLQEIDSLISDVKNEGGDVGVESTEEAEGEALTTEEGQEIVDAESSGAEGAEKVEVEVEIKERESILEEDESPVTEAVDEGDRRDGQDDTIVELKAQIEKQQQTIDELSAKLTKEPEPVVEEEQESLDEIDLTEDQLEELGSDPRALVKFLAEREKKLIQILKKEATTDTIKTLPAIVMRQVQYAKNLETAVNDFWSKNEDLRPVSKTVGVVTNEIIAESPELGINDVFEEAGKRVREMLGMKEGVLKPKKKKEKNPAFAKQKAGGDRGGEKTNTLPKGIADEIDDLL